MRMYQTARASTGRMAGTPPAAATAVVTTQRQGPHRNNGGCRNKEADLPQEWLLRQAKDLKARYLVVIGVETSERSGEGLKHI
jgi:hypothetical protein